LRKPLLFLGTIVLLVIGLFVVAYWHTRRTAEEAKALLADLQLVHLNGSLQDAQRFIDSHPGVKEVKCADPQRAQCDLVIRMNNRWLARLHALPPTDLGVWFTCSQGRVVRMGASIWVHRVIPGTSLLAYAADVTEEPSDPQLGQPRPSVHKLANSAPGVFIPWFVNQRLDERATEAQRKAAYSSLNLSCLYKLGGCKDAEALAPSTWTAADKAGWHDETNPPESH
jgi:hypothetical protein